jgi:hypothetical protein
MGKMESALFSPYFMGFNFQYLKFILEILEFFLIINNFENNWKKKLI